MKKPEKTKNEGDRLKELEAYDILNAEQEGDFDFLTKMAAQICNTEISLISLVTEDRQLFLSHHGLEHKETCKEYSFCAHALHQPDKLFIIENALEDERFQDNPLVIQEPFIHFYAGVPLVNENGYALGTLCVIDSEPKTLDVEQKKMLKSLANQVMKLLELRKKQIETSNINQELRRNLDLLEETQQANKIGGWELDIATGKTIWTEFVYHIHEVPLDFKFDKKSAIEFYHPNDREKISKAVENTIATGNRFDVTCRLITAKNNEIWVRSTGRKVGDKLIGRHGNKGCISKIYPDEEMPSFRPVSGGRDLRATFTPLGDAGEQGTLVFLEDTAQLTERAQRSGLNPGAEIMSGTRVASSHKVDLCQCPFSPRCQPWSDQSTTTVLLANALASSASRTRPSWASAKEILAR